MSKARSPGRHWCKAHAMTHHSLWRIGVHGIDRGWPDKGGLTSQAWPGRHRGPGNWGSEGCRPGMRAGRRGSIGWRGRAMNPKGGWNGVGKGHGVRRVCGGCLSEHAPWHG